MGEPGGTFELALSEWPPPDAGLRTWYLDRDGALGEAEPSEGGVDAYDHDPDAVPPCPSQRGQACREFRASSNRSEE